MLSDVGALSKTRNFHTSNVSQGVLLLHGRIRVYSLWHVSAMSKIIFKKNFELRQKYRMAAWQDFSLSWPNVRYKARDLRRFFPLSNS